MSKHVMAVFAGGLGNQIQMTCVARTLRERLGWDVDTLSTGIAVGSGTHEDFDPVLPGRVFHYQNPPDWKGYDGIVLLAFAANGARAGQERWGQPILNDPARQIVHVNHSEVDTAMNAPREFGVAEDDLIWQGELNWNEEYGERFDIVMANGYLRRESGLWDVKGYPGYGSAAAEIQRRWPKLSVCCIGRNAQEVIHGTVDRTGLPLLDSLALIRRAKVLIATDSMALHAGGALGTPTVALFTATSVTKNCDPRFHATAEVVRVMEPSGSPLLCGLMCQEQGCRWRRCDRWRCQEIGIGAIADAVGRKLEGG